MKKPAKAALPEIPQTDPLIGPYLLNPGPTAMTVRWVREDPAPCKLSYYADNGAEQTLTVAPHASIGNSADRVYTVDLTGLLPDTRYAYTLETPREAYSASFRTFPRSDSRDPFTFIYYGDNKSGHETHRRIARLFDQHAPAFVMHSGDMTDTGAYEEYRPYFFDPIRNVVDHIPLLPGRGNHEGKGGAYRGLFCRPEGNTWYAVDHGNLHVAVLDTCGWRRDTEQDAIGRMRAWFDEDLARTRSDWILVMQHETVYDLGWRKDEWGHRHFLPIMRRYGVDITLSGHAHGYQRLQPMAVRGQNERHPMIHITAAGAGASLGSKLLEPSPFLAADARSFNYMVFSIQGERLSAKVYDQNDRLLDTFTLQKHDGHYGPGFLEAAFEEADFGRPVFPYTSPPEKERR